MNTKTMAAWILSAAFSLAFLVAVIGQPLHWKRTAALTIILAVASAVLALQQSRKHTA